MIKILSVDTCAGSCSVAVHYDDKLIGETFLNAGLTHSQTLMPIVDSLLKSVGLKAKDIELFGVTSGPGSFTGLRIGMAVVKGMAFPLNRPCVPLSSLYALAINASFLDGIVCSCMDARNNQIYNAVFAMKNGQITRITPDRAILIDDFINELKIYGDKIIFIGDAAKVCYNIAGDVLDNKDLVLLSDEFNFIRASKVGEEAFKAYNLGRVFPCEKIIPEYLKLPQAERELKERLAKKGGV